jgi:hypothetical protein
VVPSTLRVTPRSYGINMSEKHDTSVVVMVIMICLGLSFTAVVLRFVSRGLILKKVNADDWLIVLSWVCDYK